MIDGPTQVEVDKNARWSAAGSHSDVPITRYEWDMGDGSGIKRGRTVTHKYRQPGTYTLTLTVTDRHGRTATTTLDVVVVAPAPKAVIQGPASVKVNKQATFKGAKSSSYWPIVSYEWDMGDGTRSLLTTPEMTHRWTQPGTYTVTLTVTDQAGNQGTATLTVQVKP